MTQEPAGVARTRSGVRPPEPPGLRWDPGARYRPSVLASPGASGDDASTSKPVAQRHTGSWVLPGRLFRGPAVRKAVFDRPVWSPHAGGPCPPQFTARLAADLADAVERYRRGALNTTGLVRAVGNALAA